MFVFQRVMQIHLYQFNQFPLVGQFGDLHIMPVPVSQIDFSFFSQIRRLILLPVIFNIILHIAQFFIDQLQTFVNKKCRTANNHVLILHRLIHIRLYQRIQDIFSPLCICILVSER